MAEADRSPLQNVCLLPVLNSVGGPTSFQIKLMNTLEQRGVQAHHNPRDPHTKALLVIAGTRRLGELWRAKRRGVRIVQRLDGMNWVHRVRRTGLRHYLRSEYGNLLLAFIRRFIADHVVYQSEFTRGWWQRVYGKTSASDEVILNGVDLGDYTLLGPGERPADRVRVQVVEGHLKDGHDLALEYAARFAQELQRQVGQRVELCVAGDVPQAVQTRASEHFPQLWLTFQGVVARSQIPEIDRSAHLLYSAEVNAPCPNSVIEALACGLPVAAFDSGSLPELIQGEAGRLAPYGANPWKMEFPDFPSLAQAAVEIVREQERYRKGARQRAEQTFDLQKMTDSYLLALSA